MEISNAEYATTHLELRIEADTKSVWKALTENIDAWWPAEFYAGGSAGQRKFLIEATAGRSNV